LLYRLNVYSVLVPPLRERIDDLPALIDHFIKKFNTVHGKKVRGMTDMAVTMLRAYAWPGNIRELGNTIERGVILAEPNGYIEASAFPGLAMPRASAVLGSGGLLVSAATETVSASGAGFFDSGQSLEQFELSIMREALARSNGKVSKAARLLGLTRPALDYRLKKAGIATSSHKN